MLARNRGKARARDKSQVTKCRDVGRDVAEGARSRVWAILDAEFRALSCGKIMSRAEFPAHAPRLRPQRRANWPDPRRRLEFPFRCFEGRPWYETIRTQRTTGFSFPAAPAMSRAARHRAIQDAHREKE